MATRHIFLLLSAFSTAGMHSHGDGKSRKIASIVSEDHLINQSINQLTINMIPESFIANIPQLRRYTFAESMNLGIMTNRINTRRVNVVRVDVAVRCDATEECVRHTATA